MPPILPSARSARSRAGYFHARQNRLPRAPLRGAPQGASLTRSGPSRCAPSVFTTDGGYDDHALRPHPGTAGRAAGLPFHASANAPRSRRSWPRLWPNRPRSSATSTARWRPTAKRKRPAASGRRRARALLAPLLKALAEWQLHGGGICRPHWRRAAPARNACHPVQRPIEPRSWPPNASPTLAAVRRSCPPASGAGFLGTAAPDGARRSRPQSAPRHAALNRCRSLPFPIPAPDPVAGAEQHQSDAANWSARRRSRRPTSRSTSRSATVATSPPTLSIRARSPSAVRPRAPSVAAARVVSAASRPSSAPGRAAFPA